MKIKGLGAVHKLCLIRFDWCVFLAIYAYICYDAQKIKILYKEMITILHGVGGGGYGKRITILQGGGGIPRPPKSDNVIHG